MAMTRNDCSASTSRMVKTVSYRIAFPTFLEDSVFVATCARMSFIADEASTSPLPSNRKRRRIFTCRNGSVMPDTSCSGE